MTARLDPGPMPELAWVPVGKCDVDRRYQRSLESRRSQDLIARIAAGWRWASCGCLLAVRDRERFKLIDGQHRAEAAKRIGIEYLPALVVAELSIEDQAEAFVRANLDRVNVNQFALHHARLVAGDAAAREVDDLARSAGIIIPRYPIPSTKLKPGETMALATFAWLRRSYSLDLCKTALRCVAEAYEGRAGFLRAATFKAVAAVLDATSPAERKGVAAQITRVLRDTPASEIAAATAQRRADGQGEVAALRTTIAVRLKPSAAPPAAKRDAPRPGVVSAPSRNTRHAPPPSPKKLDPGAARSPAAQPKGRSDDDELIARHIAEKGVTRAVSFGAHQAVVDAARAMGLEVLRLKTGAQQPAAWSLNGIGIRRTDELYRRVNLERGRRGLEPVKQPEAAEA